MSATQSEIRIVAPQTSQTASLPGDEGRLTLRCVKSRAEVEELREIWTRWNRHPKCDIDSYLLADRVRPEILRPHIMVIYRGAQPECLLVGRLQEERMSVRMGGAKILLPKATVLYFLYEGLLGNATPESGALLVTAIQNCLQQGDADLAEFNGLPVELPLYDCARNLPRWLCRDRFPVIVRHRTATLPKTFHELVSSLPRKDRHNLKTQKARLLQTFSGRVRIQCFRREEELEDMIGDVEEIARKSYQRALGLGFMNDGETREELRREARQGLLYGYVSYIDNEPGAFIIATRYRGTLYGRFMGFDPKFSHYSVGSHLLSHCLEQTFLQEDFEKIDRVDFEPGSQRYKRIWFRQDREEATVDIFAPTWKALGLNLLRTVLVVGYQSGRWLIVKANLRDRATRTWREIVARYAQSTLGTRQAGGHRPHQSPQQALPEHAAPVRQSAAESLQQHACTAEVPVGPARNT